MAKRKRRRQKGERYLVKKGNRTVRSFKMLTKAGAYYDKHDGKSKRWHLYTQSEIRR